MFLQVVKLSWLLSLIAMVISADVRTSTGEFVKENKEAFLAYLKVVRQFLLEYSQISYTNSCLRFETETLRI
jgi:hypothetical protein